MATEHKEKRPLSITDDEIGILKAVFSENESLLKSIRSLFFGFPITDDEKKVIMATFKDEKVREAFRKKLYPIISPDASIGEVADYWMSTVWCHCGYDNGYH